MHLNPAEYVIWVFGGVRKTAKALGRDHSTIVRWTKPANESGRGGRVPASARHEILDLAKQLGLDINSHDLDFGRHGLKVSDSDLDRAIRLRSK